MILLATKPGFGRLEGAGKAGERACRAMDNGFGKAAFKAPPFHKCSSFNPGNSFVIGVLATFYRWESLSEARHPCSHSWLDTDTPISLTPRLYHGKMA